MNSGEIFGYIASVLVFATFYMRTMLPLRIVAVASNLAFITYAAIDGLAPILILHSALLPLNLLRLMQIRELGAQVERASSHEFSAAAILPFMKKRVVRANEVLFSAGDLAEELFYVLEGEVGLYDGRGWQEAGPGDFLYVPEGGLHGFRGGNHARMLLMFTPGAPREDYFETLADTARREAMTPEDWTEFFLRHDTFWV